MDAFWECEMAIRGIYNRYGDRGVKSYLNSNSFKNLGEQQQHIVKKAIREHGPSVEGQKTYQGFANHLGFDKFMAKRIGDSLRSFLDNPSN